MPVSRRKRSLSTRNTFRVDIGSAKGGVNTLISSNRLKTNESVELTNMWLIEDGIPDKRPGTAAYGSVTFTNRPDGAAEFTKTDGTRELIVVADGKVYLVTTTTKTEITGATYTQGTRVYMVQYNAFLYISNGVDAMGRYNGTTLTTYSSISAPTWDGTPITRTGLTAGSYNNYYKVSALNDIGETLATSTAVFTTNLPRENWDATNYLTLGWADVSNATKYNVYYGDTSGFETKLDETTASTYRDNNTAVLNPYIETPTSDTSTGPKFTDMAIVNNRIWGTGDPSYPYRVYFSGTGVNKGNFAPGYGGGWIDLDKGGKETTTAVEDFQGIAHIWTKTADGHGSIWRISLNSVTIDGTTTSITVPVPTKIIASVGCDSGRGPIKVENDILFPNKQGVYVLGNEPGILGVLRTNELSAKIRPTWRSLDGASLNKIASYYYQAKVYFAVSSATGEPDKIMIFDRERSSWVSNWTIGVSQFLEFTDSAGATHLLGIAATKLIEFDAGFESDSGTAFMWKYVSGRIPVDNKMEKFGRVEKAVMKFRNITGSVDVSVAGTSRQSQYSSVGATSVTSGSSNSGLGFDQLGVVQIGSTLGTPSLYSTDSFIKYLRIKHNKNIVRDIQWTISGDSVGDRAIISNLSIVGKTSEVPLLLSDGL